MILPERLSGKLLACFFYERFQQCVASSMLLYHHQHQALWFQEEFVNLTTSDLSMFVSLVIDWASIFHMYLLIDLFLSVSCSFTFFLDFFQGGWFRRTLHTFRKRSLIFVIESFLECHLSFIYLWCLLTYGSFKLLGNHICGSFPLWFLPLLLHVMISIPRTRLLDCKDCGHSILNKVPLVYLVSSWSYR